MTNNDISGGAIVVVIFLGTITGIMIAAATKKTDTTTPKTSPHDTVTKIKHLLEQKNLK